MTRSWRKRRRKKRSAPGAQAGSPGLCRPLTGSSFLSCALLTTRGFERMQETLSVVKKRLATWQTEAQMVMLTSSPERQVDASSAHGESGAGQGREETCQKMGWAQAAWQKQNQNGRDKVSHNMAHLQSKRPNKEEATVLWRHVGDGPRQILQLYFK